ncbi:MAG TPA: hypothetical protein VGR88_00145, partial [Ktedonobacterales bacterium]|nr:hypothetical protein [Ktedonobacterales bacterium]
PRLYVATTRMEERRDMGETYLDDIWSLTLHDEQTHYARSGDFGMLRPWRAAPHSGPHAGNAWLDIAPAPLGPLAPEADHPS